MFSNVKALFAAHPYAVAGGVLFVLAVFVAVHVL